ncbi:MAG: sensor protein [Phycisphaerales bacterium]|nr:sensor protein [Phycisphaerales bacterium]
MATATEIDNEASRPRGRWRGWVTPAALLLLQAAMLAWMVDCLVSRDLERAAWLAQFMLSLGAALAAIGLAARRKRRLYGPLGRIELLLPEIRAGRVAIEELSNIEGRLAPLAAQIQELFRELRSQKATMAGTDQEVRQRVANRTEALERKIGSLRHQATRDVLTGLFNRRMLDEQLAQAIERCQTGGILLTLMMIDVDNFKLLNDTLGHAAGDDLLRSMGQIIRSTIRETDAAFRVGGDEFVILLEGTEPQAAQALAARLTSLVDGLANTLHVSKPARLSIGLAHLSDLRVPSPEALLHNADEALYRIKADRKRASAPAPAGHTSLSVSDR